MQLWKNGQRDATLLALKVEKGAKSQGMWVASRRSWKRQGNGFISGASKKECSPADTLILAQLNPCQTPNLQNYKIIHFCCSKSLRLW